MVTSLVCLALVKKNESMKTVRHFCQRQNGRSKVVDGVLVWVLSASFNPKIHLGYKWLLGGFLLHFSRPGLRQNDWPLPQGSQTLLATWVKDGHLRVNGRTLGETLQCYQH